MNYSLSQYCEPFQCLYSIHRAVSAATVSPCSLLTACNDRSIPAEIPAEVITRPLSINCLLGQTVARGATSRSKSIAPQCVVAETPSSNPAFASSSDPVQTDKVNSALSADVLIQSIKG